MKEFLDEKGVKKLWNKVKEHHKSNIVIDIKQGYKIPFVYENSGFDIKIDGFIDNKAIKHYNLVVTNTANNDILWDDILDESTLKDFESKYEGYYDIRILNPLEGTIENTNELKLQIYPIDINDEGYFENIGEGLETYITVYDNTPASLPEDFSITLDSTEIDETTGDFVVEEGTYIPIILRNTENVDLDNIVFKVFYNYSQLGQPNYQPIYEYITISEDLVMYIPPIENRNHTTRLKVYAVSKEYKDCTEVSIPGKHKRVANFTVKGVALQSINLNCKENEGVLENSDLYNNRFVFPSHKDARIKVEGIPANNTKLRKAKCFCETQNIRFDGEYMTFNDIYDGFFGGDVCTNWKLEFGVPNVKKLESYIKNPKYDEDVSYTDCEILKKGDTITIKVYNTEFTQYSLQYDVKAEFGDFVATKLDQTTGEVIDDYPEASPTYDLFHYLRQRTNIYVGKYNNDTGVMSLVKTLRHNNNSIGARFYPVRYFIDGDVLHRDCDLWMKLDIDVYYSISENTLMFWLDLPDSRVEELISQGFVINKWDKNTLIGVFKASSFKEDKYNPERLCSRMNVTPKTGSPNNLKKLAKNRGDAFTVTTYEFAQFLTYLFYGYYREIDSKYICGYGTRNVIEDVNGDYTCFPKTTGYSYGLYNTITPNIDYDTYDSGNSGSADDSTILNTDITTPNHSKLRSNNFWGLENFQGDVTEVLSNIVCLNIHADPAKDSINNIDDDIYVSYYLNIYGITSLPVVIRNMRSDYQFITLTKDNYHSFGGTYFAILDKDGVPTRLVEVKGKSLMAQVGPTVFADIVNMGNETYVYERSMKCFQSIGGGKAVVRGGFSNTQDSGICSLYTTSPTSTKLANSNIENAVGARLQFNGTDETIKIVDLQEFMTL